MLIPNRLKKGQTIGIYSPSGSVAYTREETSLYERGLAAIEACGYNTKEAPHARDRFYHMAATAKNKANDIHSLFVDEEVAAILPSVGGHTASQVLGYLDPEVIRAHPKIFIGFSDSAVLASFITAKADLVTYHSAVDVMFGFSRFGLDECPMEGNGVFTREAFWQMMEHGTPSSTPYSKWLGLRNGSCSGQLIGGNIKGIQALIGTRFEPDWRGKVLYWEAADPPHVMAQVLSHLRNAGVLDAIGGMVIGKVSHLKESFYGFDEIMPIHKFVDYITEGLDIPIMAEADFGHDVENITIPNGCTARLQVDREHCTLDISHG